MNLIHLSMCVLALVGAIKAQQEPQGHNVFVIVLDRATNRPLDAEVWVGAWSTKTQKGKATFVGVEKGQYQLVIIPDDDQYVIANGIIGVPQHETLIVQMTKREAPK